MYYNYKIQCIKVCMFICVVSVSMHVYFYTDIRVYWYVRIVFIFMLTNVHVCMNI